MLIASALVASLLLASPVRLLEANNLAKDTLSCTHNRIGGCIPEPPITRPRPRPEPFSGSQAGPRGLRRNAEPALERGGEIGRARIAGKIGGLRHGHAFPEQGIAGAAQILRANELEHRHAVSRMEQPLQRVDADPDLLTDGLQRHRLAGIGLDEIARGIDPLPFARAQSGGLIALAHFGEHLKGFGDDLDGAAFQIEVAEQGAEGAGREHLLGERDEARRRRPAEAVQMRPPESADRGGISRQLQPGRIQPFRLDGDMHLADEIAAHRAAHEDVGLRIGDQQPLRLRPPPPAWPRPEHEAAAADRGGDLAFQEQGAGDARLVLDPGGQVLQFARAGGMQREPGPQTDQPVIAFQRRIVLRSGRGEDGEAVSRQIRNSGQIAAPDHIGIVLQSQICHRPAMPLRTRPFSL